MPWVRWTRFRIERIGGLIAPREKGKSMRKKAVILLLAMMLSLLGSATLAFAEGASESLENGGRASAVPLEEPSVFPSNGQAATVAPDLRQVGTRGVLMALDEYDPEAVAVINGIIDENGLTGFSKDDPANWIFATWNERWEDEPHRLSALDLSGQNLTGRLYITGIESLESLDVSSNVGLTALRCEENNLTSLSVSGCSGLIALNCSSNELEDINVGDCMGLTGLDCSRNYDLQGLNLSSNTVIQELNCRWTKISSLNTAGLPNLVSLDCSSTSLTSLDLANNASLTGLSCAGIRNLGSLNVSSNTNLEYLDCTSSHLTSLNVSNCLKLEELNADSNFITSIDLSANRLLKKVSLDNNLLTELDLSGCPDLEELACGRWPGTASTADRSLLTSFTDPNGNTLTVATDPKDLCIVGYSSQDGLYLESSIIPSSDTERAFESWSFSPRVEFTDNTNTMMPTVSFRLVEDSEVRLNRASFTLPPVVYLGALGQENREDDVHEEPPPTAWYVVGDGSESWTLLSVNSLGNGFNDNGIYAGGEMQQTTLDLLGGFGAEELEAIRGRDLTDISPAALDQKLWLLSYQEILPLNPVVRGQLKRDWWLRTPFGTEELWHVSVFDGRLDHREPSINYQIRPGLDLDLSHVLLASAADSAAPASADSSLCAYAAPREMKLTLSNGSGSLNGFSVSTPEAGSYAAADGIPVSYAYSGNGAQGGEFLRACLSQNGETVYQGVIAADLSSSGTAVIPLDGVEPGSYEARVWVERAGDAYRSNIACEPSTGSVSVSRSDQSAAKEWTDKSTGIRVSGVFLDGQTPSGLAIQALEENSDDYAALMMAGKLVIAAYEIRLNGSYALAPNEKLHVLLPVDASLNGKQILIRHRMDDGTVEEFSPRVRNGTAEIEVSQLSPFMVLADSSYLMNSAEPGENGVPNATHSIPGVGDDLGGIPIVLLLVISAGAVLGAAARREAAYDDGRIRKRII